MVSWCRVEDVVGHWHFPWRKVDETAYQDKRTTHGRTTIEFEDAGMMISFSGCLWRGHCKHFSGCFREADIGGIFLWKVIFVLLYSIVRDNYSTAL